jgi:ligand-binding sensor domain-containing protein/DNA-binding CsgD family transcriptional regulator
MKWVRYILVFKILISPFFLFCQNTIGFPDVINYSKDNYRAGLQNWDIKQDKNGIIYIANNEGLISFDGENWVLYPLPNKTIVRSVEIGPDNKIYVGGQDEVGYFSPSKNGTLGYHSLLSFIPAKDKSFGDVWDIIALGGSIYLRTQARILKLTNETVKTYYASFEWSYLGICNDRLYAHDAKMGLMVFNNDNWSPLPLVKSELPANDPVTSIIPIQNDSILITTLKHGMYIFSRQAITKIQSLNNRYFEEERIYAATKVNSEWVALATNNNGIYITDHKGKIIQNFSRTYGLQNNNVLTVFLDKQNNLWLGLDNGIDLIAYNSAIKQINPLLKSGSGYSAIIHNNRLYIGTSGGLFSVPLETVRDLSFSKGNFEPVANTTGQTWALSEINNQLLLGHHDGVYRVTDNTAASIIGKPGFWNFIPLSETYPITQIIAGNYNGIRNFNFINNTFVPATEIPGFNESSRFITTDNENNIWVSHPYHGVFKITAKNDDRNFAIHSYTVKNGLPSTLNNHIYKIKNEIVVATEKGIYKYNTSKNSFEPNRFYLGLLGTQSIRYLKEDNSGNIWFIHEKNIGVIDFSGVRPAIISIPELNNKMLSGFEFIYPVNGNNIFLGGEKGFYHINYDKYIKTTRELEVKIRSVHIIANTDSVLFGGYFKEVNEKQIQGTDDIPEIKNKWKTIRFQFSSSLFGNKADLEYSYQLKGFDESWSPWTNRTEKEYTNLPARTYTFNVKLRNNLGNESAAAEFSFTILPPWYQTAWAYIIYGLVLSGIIYLLYKWQKRKFIIQQAKHEKEQKSLQYIHELELNKTESQLVALKNEKLESEIKFKNSELASSAMHLVKKGELLSKIRGELTQMMKDIENPQAVAELKKMIKTLNEEESIDAEWENVTKHFDIVHADFVKQVKNRHPGITPNELKLCAYLRMNLTTKEIAQLMNISVRGVEISRYRLRKKLQISTEVNLVQFLMELV